MTEPAGDLGAAPSAPPTGLLGDYARIVARRRPGTLERTVQRTGSLEGRRLLAWLATSGGQTLEWVHEELGRPWDQPLAPPGAGTPWDERWLAALAQVLATQDAEPEDQARALCAFEHLHRLDPSVLTRRQQQTHLDLLVRGGWRARGLEVVESSTLPEALRARHRADLHNPHLWPAEHLDPARWMDLLVDVVPAELGPLSVLPGAPTPFDGLWAPSTSAPVSRGLVSVVMAVHEPGPHLFRALSSVLRQSHRDLEVLVVDDASGPGYDEVLERVRGLDERVTVLRMATNSGPYRCRNYALGLARGDYVTFHDDDDWAHPDRLARQVAALEADDGAVATLSRCLRASEDLGLVRVGYRELTTNTSSLMFRRRPVLARVGFFDSVRKGGDTEFVRRLAAAFGDAAVVELPLVLAVVRVGLSSLSSADFRPGWSHRGRWAYKMLYARWHQSVREGLASPLRTDLLGRDRTYPVPRALTGSAFEPRHYDVVVVGDWRAHGGPQKSMLAEIDALVGAGRRVAVAHLEAFRFMTVDDRPLCDPLLRLVERGVVDLVLLDEPVQADTVTIRYPPVLQFAQRRRSGWTVQRLFVIANQAPFERDGSDHRYVPAVCSATAEAVFGRRPVWVPQGPVVREVLTGLVLDDELAGEDCPGLVDLRDWPGRSGVVPPTWPSLVVGRLSRDAPNKFPVTEQELLAAYAFPQGGVVRMMGATRTVPTLLTAAAPSNWELLPVDAVEVPTFLAGLDVFVYFDNPHAREAFGRVVLEAVAAGCVVVLPERYRATFGGAAVYCEADEVASVVERLCRDPAAWAERLRTARSVLVERFTGDAFLAQLARGWG